MNRLSPQSKREFKGGGNFGGRRLGDLKGPLLSELRMAPARHVARKMPLDGLRIGVVGKLL